MARRTEDMKKIAQLNSLFLDLSNKEQDGVLAILKALEFAQSARCLQKHIVETHEQSGHS